MGPKISYLFSYVGYHSHFDKTRFGYMLRTVNSAAHLMPKFGLLNDIDVDWSASFLEWLPKAHTLV